MVDFAPATSLPVARTIAERIALLPAAERARLLERMEDDELLEFAYDWRIWARPEQLPENIAGDWVIAGAMSGRGSGKTRLAGEWFREEVETGEHEFSHMVGRSAGDVRKTMIEGESGILRIADPDFYPKYEPSKKRLLWPNGHITLLFNATEPEELRGPQCSLFWADEVAAWKRASETWDQLMYGFRLGRRPRGIFTTTPKPIKLVRDLVSDRNIRWLPRMSTYDNATNLAKPFLDTVIGKYAGTRQGRQELFGELLTDLPGALWRLAWIEDQRLSRKHAPKLEELDKIVVAVDPAVSVGEDSNETGIIVVGRDRRRPVPHFYVLHDESGRWTATQWPRKVRRLFRDYQANYVVGEVNNGGDLVEAALRVVDNAIPFKKVHASRGKYIRGEPAAGLYQQKRVHHVGLFGPLEDQMVTFLPDDERDEDSPDRADALIWGLSELKDVIEETEPPRSAQQRSLR